MNGLNEWTDEWTNEWTNEWTHEWTHGPMNEPMNGPMNGPNGGPCVEDVQWLGLKEGTDFASMVDLAGVWRVWNPQFNSWSVFGQDHLVKTLLGAEAGGGRGGLGEIWGTGATDHPRIPFTHAPHNGTLFVLIAALTPR